MQMHEDKKNMAIKTWAISLLLMLFSLSISAQEAQPFAKKTWGKLTAAQEKLITDFFLYLNKFWADEGKSLSRKLTEEYLDPDTTLIINGRTVYTGYNQFESHFKEVGKNIRGKIHFPLLEVIGVGNKLVVRFDEDIYDNNETNYPANVIAIFTIYRGKISRWEEVVYTRYFYQNGFKIVSQYDMDGNTFIADKSLNILTVARKEKP